MQLGKKVRELRLRRGMTVQQLAQASSLSKGFISQVENDRTSPSLTTLQDLARALQTTAAYLVVEGEQAPYVVRSNERRHLAHGLSTPGVEVLSACPKRNLEVLIMELPAAVSAGERHCHHGEECVLCMDGRVMLTIGDSPLTLETGDSCHFDGRVPHAIENAGTVAARLLIAITPAAFEPTARGEARSAASNGSAEVESVA